MTLASTTLTEDRNAFADGQSIRLCDHLESFVGRCEVRGLRPGTLRTYRFNIKLYIAPHIGELRLSEVTPQRLNALYETLLRSGVRDRSRGVGARTVRSSHTILRRALADAVRLGLIETNAALAADPPSARSARAAPRPTWSVEELKCFLASARDDPYYAAYYVAMATGVRRSELLGLRWCDVDLERAELRVVQTVVVLGCELYVGPPKSDSGRRLIALDETTVEVLAAHRLEQEERAWAIGREIGSSDLVFAKPDGSLIHPAVVAYHFQRCVSRAGVSRIVVHDLRHTHATLALQLGIHPKIVSERLGHSSVMITLDTYSHSVPSLQREAAAAFGSLLDATSGDGSDQRYA